jgi:23S rRNA (adenine2503-C2)-methyltransferase
MVDSKDPYAKIELYGLSKEELSELLASWGYSAFHANELWTYMYREKRIAFENVDRLRMDLIQDLRKSTTLESVSPLTSIDSADGHTRKVLLQLNDGQAIETVFMRFQDRETVCISTQVGCAMGCVFCATGQMGFIRNLSVSEMVAQVIEASRHFDSLGHVLRNVVLMGMGEPLHNYENTMDALRIVTDDTGLAIAPRRITVSTIGVVPSVKKLANEELPVNLAVSVHAANDAHRNQLAPVNKRWPLKELIEACRYYSDKTGRRIFFEWALIGNNNDDPAQARELGQLLSGMKAHVNLIPYNPIDGYAGEQSDEKHIRKFQEILREYGLPSTVRQKRGLDIEAGCGQLRTTAISR